ncbi:hypothetical protein [Algicola sagamiensis]|uniref:hypothetical protein n=1 Tax=Algicola sagamiensis TaxID=163869 RepID=UPI001FE1C234|nr:hypothetical protein [Algicola sagamiensis]
MVSASYDNYFLSCPLDNHACIKPITQHLNHQLLFLVDDSILSSKTYGLKAMDLNTLIALLTLIVIVVGGILSMLWNKVHSLTAQVADERVVAAEKYLTKQEMDRRLEQTIAPLERMLERLETQNTQIFQLLNQQHTKDIPS